MSIVVEKFEGREEVISVIRGSRQSGLPTNMQTTGGGGVEVMACKRRVTTGLMLVLFR
jgi:hypothetical protein